MTRADRQTPLQMLEEVVDLSAGLGILLLPLLLTALPGVLLLLVLPGLLLLAAVGLPAVIAAAVVAPPYLLIRSIRRRRGRAP